MTEIKDRGRNSTLSHYLLILVNACHSTPPALPPAIPISLDSVALTPRHPGPQAKTNELILPSSILLSGLGCVCIERFKLPPISARRSEPHYLWPFNQQKRTIFTPLWTSMSHSSSPRLLKVWQTHCTSTQIISFLTEVCVWVFVLQKPPWRWGAPPGWCINFLKRCVMISPCCHITDSCPAHPVQNLI